MWSRSCWCDATVASAWCRWSTTSGTSSAGRSLLLCRRRRGLGVPRRPPAVFLRLLWFACRGAQGGQAVQGLGDDPVAGLGRDVLLALLQALVTLGQQRLGFIVPAQAEQGAAEHRAGV